VSTKQKRRQYGESYADKKNVDLLAPETLGFQPSCLAIDSETGWERIVLRQISILVVNDRPVSIGRVDGNVLMGGHIIVPIFRLRVRTKVISRLKVTIGKRMRSCMRNGDGKCEWIRVEHRLDVVIGALISVRHGRWLNGSIVPTASGSPVLVSSLGNIVI
jgi:hypothetical protein